MSTWKEARVGRENRITAERVRKEHAQRVDGPICPACKTRTWKPYFDATGDPVHPCCREPEIMRLTVRP